MNSFIVFADRNKQAGELRSLAQYLSLLGDIIQVENGRIDNDKYMVAESEIKELVSSSSALLASITNKLTKEECKSPDVESSINLMKRMVEDQEVVETVDTEKIEKALKDIHDVADMSRQKVCALTSIGVDQIDSDLDVIEIELGKRPLRTGYWIVNEFDDNRLTPIRTCSVCGNYLRIAVSPDFCCFCGSAMKDG